jgi:hypothetical protein
MSAWLIACRTRTTMESWAVLIKRELQWNRIITEWNRIMIVYIACRNTHTIRL